MKIDFLSPLGLHFSFNFSYFVQTNFRKLLKMCKSRVMIMNQAKWRNIIDWKKYSYHFYQPLDVEVPLDLLINRPSISKIFILSSYCFFFPQPPPLGPNDSICSLKATKLTTRSRGWGSNCSYWWGVKLRVERVMDPLSQSQCRCLWRKMNESNMSDSGQVLRVFTIWNENIQYIESTVIFR